MTKKSSIKAVVHKDSWALCLSMASVYHISVVGWRAGYARPPVRPPARAPPSGSWSASVRFQSPSLGWAPPWTPWRDSQGGMGCGRRWRGTQQAGTAPPAPGRTCGWCAWWRGHDPGWTHSPLAAAQGTSCPHPPALQHSTVPHQGIKQLI